MPRAIIAALTVAALLSTPALASELAGVRMDDTVQVGDETLRLNGMALRSKMMFKVYVAGLYLPAQRTDAARVLTEDTTRRLVMHWVRSVDKESICEGWQEGLAANTPGASAELEEQFDTLCTWMEDARTGDRFEFTYVPGQGTRVAVKGKSKGTLEGKAFADALFACWIGPEPGPGEGFKEDLMGG